MKHIVLLGDSIFDNSSYVNFGELDVSNQLRSLVGLNCKVTNLAVDGHLIRHVKNQLNNLPSDVTHLFVSVGGNDGLGLYKILGLVYSFLRDLVFLILVSCHLVLIEVEF